MLSRISLLFDALNDIPWWLTLFETSLQIILLSFEFVRWMPSSPLPMAVLYAIVLLSHDVQSTIPPPGL